MILLTMMRSMMSVWRDLVGLEFVAGRQLISDPKERLVSSTVGSGQTGGQPSQWCCEHRRPSHGNRQHPSARENRHERNRGRAHMITRLRYSPVGKEISGDNSVRSTVCYQWYETRCEDPHDVCLVAIAIKQVQRGVPLTLLFHTVMVYRSQFEIVSETTRDELQRD